MKKYLTKRNLIIACVVIFVASSFITYKLINSPRRTEQQILMKLGDNQGWLKQYSELKEKIKKNEEKDGKDQSALLSLGFAWKGLGDATKDNYFLQQALKMYQQGIDQFGSENIIFYWSAGSVASSMGKFEMAENYYKSAITVAPAYAEGYTYLAELYRFKMKKNSDEVIKIYDDGLKATSGNSQLFLERSSYLRAIGRYEESLAGYKDLLNQNPNNKGFEDVIWELEEKLKK
ncbi:MAG: hypothetical protein UU49_C0026G0009 [Candidatus Magasanikbacteria bacterium GW2011_GWC2_41_17]|uniref:Uncharacterized protein n=2 Tax=Candidatus Magasanikiibacteriota TaxID=1752731 RepID=A0A0G0YSM7_9BACT|nr:MAG: hypothetical protein UU49_C0026G0009 [Candidatus Magasanikbacteria bacterium GW2011_GWC2_41_17]KKS12691.1 MAG: hypothetical protein UU69_C0026G0007 [Candidatus Magasanikbacteria bacterium GW2011_GWA2_41_55]HBX15959.1 hypothetical protein [Candidatus Magasanikbacteria bacterium]